MDNIRFDNGPLVLEVISTSSLEGIETATGKDIAGEIIAFIEQRRQ